MRSSALVASRASSSRHSKRNRSTLAFDVEQVARRLRAQHRVTEQLPERRDRILERALRGWRRSLTPEIVEQLVD